jgi:DNA-binding GntR family transcriptional regulator
MSTVARRSDVGDFTTKIDGGSDRSLPSEGGTARIAPLTGASAILEISKPVSAREAAVHRLRQAIVEGLLPPGSRLSEPEIARAMGISRAPLREAMFQLEREGLLSHEAQHGARVMQVSTNEVAEIYGLRAVIERGAAEIVAGTLSAQDTDELRDRANELADQTRSPEELFRLDLEFHEQVCLLAGNGRLLEVWRRLRNQALVCYSLTTMSHLLRDRDYSQKLVGDHIELLATLGKSKHVAGETFQNHIQVACLRLLEVIASQETNR